MPENRRCAASISRSDPARSERPRLRKSLGQHHLRSGAICRPLVEFLRPAGRFVVEIGPGGGVLTRELIAAGARVLALEIDPEWATTLRERIPGPELEVRVADALEVDWTTFPAGTLVAGNLPYNVGGPIVERVLAACPPVERAAFLLQREVVDRMCADAGEAAYGALSVLVKLRAEARRLGIVRPGAFVPPPKVDSAFVGFVPRTLPAELTGGRAPRFESFVRQAFGQRRKTLVNALGARFERADILSAIAGVNRPAAVRAEALSLDELLAIFDRLERIVAAAAGGTISSTGKHEET